MYMLYDHPMGHALLKVIKRAVSCWRELSAAGVLLEEEEGVGGLIKVLFTPFFLLMSTVSWCVGTFLAFSSWLPSFAYPYWALASAPPSAFSTHMFAVSLHSS